MSCDLLAEIKNLVLTEVERRVNERSRVAQPVADDVAELKTKLRETERKLRRSRRRLAKCGQ